MQRHRWNCCMMLHGSVIVIIFAIIIFIIACLCLSPSAWNRTRSLTYLKGLLPCNCTDETLLQDVLHGSVIVIIVTIIIIIITRYACLCLSPSAWNRTRSPTYFKDLLPCNCTDETLLQDVVWVNPHYHHHHHYHYHRHHHHHHHPCLLLYVLQSINMEHNKITNTPLGIFSQANTLTKHCHWLLCGSVIITITIISIIILTIATIVITYSTCMSCSPSTWSTTKITNIPQGIFSQANALTKYCHWMLCGSVIITIIIIIVIIINLTIIATIVITYSTCMSCSPSTWSTTRSPTYR